MSKRRRQRPPHLTPLQASKPTPSPDPDTTLFHRKQLVQTAWALVVLAVGGAAGVMWQRYQGPTRVVVLNPDTTTRVVVQSDSVQQALLRRVVGEMTALRLATLPGVSRPAPAGSDTLAALFADSPNPVQIPPFVLPVGTKGYSLSDIGVFARAVCPSSSYRTGSDIAAELTLRSARDTARLSPVHVFITRRASTTGGVQVFGQQYSLLPRSLLVFPAPSSPGRYVLEFGVFLRAPTTEQYPSFYRRECTLEID